MITKRIIPCLDVRAGRVVKGTNFEGVKDVSCPVELAKYYSANGAEGEYRKRKSALFCDALCRRKKPSVPLVYSVKKAESDNSLARNFRVGGVIIYPHRPHPFLSFIVLHYTTQKRECQECSVDKSLYI